MGKHIVAVVLCIGLTAALSIKWLHHGLAFSIFDEPADTPDATELGLEYPDLQEHMDAQPLGIECQEPDDANENIFVSNCR